MTCGHAPNDKGMKPLEPIIQTERLSHIYSAGTPFEHGALVDVDFTAYRGE